MEKRTLNSFIEFITQNGINPIAFNRYAHVKLN